MQIGQSVEAIVLANKIWNNTGIRLERQQTYHFEVATDDRWSDAAITCSADGFTSPTAFMGAWEWARRARSVNWFLLMGSIDKRTLFSIGTHLVKTMTEGGSLFCYANDVITMYWNNRGSVRLKISRTQ
jgi:hypothetical protein